MRAYMEENIIPHVFEWEEKKLQPKELFKQIADQGFIAAAMFPLPSKEYMQDITLPAGIDVILSQTLLIDSMISGTVFTISSLMMSLVESLLLALQWWLMEVFSSYSLTYLACQIGLPPIIHFGSEAMKSKIIPECLKGEKRICLAITEPAAGSDVGGLTTTAVKSPDGKHYIVNGEKKWVSLVVIIC
jgi:alkylation response protein AidB-like acyl-CoA dehydrogenase